jgi:phage tail-like protein
MFRFLALLPVLAALLAAPTLSKAQQRPTPYPVDRVVMDIGGELIVFDGCSGIGSENEAIEQTSGGVIQVTPGDLRYNQVTCWRTIGSDLTLWQWRELVEMGNLGSARMTVTVQMIAPRGTVLASWELNNAWPIALTTRPNPESSQYILEVITIVFDGYTPMS